jgi:hypothetical protein
LTSLVIQTEMGEFGLIPVVDGLVLWLVLLNKNNRPIFVRHVITYSTSTL